MAYSIVQIPNSVLTSPTKSVTKFDEKLRKIIKEMSEALLKCVDPQGVGLAAPQVGLSLQLFIMKPHEESEIVCCINPKILKVEYIPETPLEKKNKKKSPPLEGCLSIPKIWAPVNRPNKVLLTYQDETGRVLENWFTGFEATIIQHEIDHLNGILFTSRATEQNNQIYQEEDGELVKIKL